MGRLKPKKGYKIIVFYRSSITGQIVTEKFAKANPNTTTREEKYQKIGTK